MFFLHMNFYDFVSLQQVFKVTYIFTSQVIIPLIISTNVCCILGMRISLRIDDFKYSFIPSLNSHLLQAKCQLNYYMNQKETSQKEISR